MDSMLLGLQGHMSGLVPLVVRALFFGCPRYLLRIAYLAGGCAESVNILFTAIYRCGHFAVVNRMILDEGYDLAARIYCSRYV